MASSGFEDVALQALDLSKSAVLANLRFMNGAYAALRPFPAPASTLATDGSLMRFDPRAIALAYAREPAVVARDYLHVVLHNVFLHPFVGEGVVRDLWDFACDLAVEKTISDLALPSTHAAREEQQAVVWARLGELPSPLTAETLYRALIDKNLAADDVLSLRAPFIADDHRPWHRAFVEENAGKKTAGTSEEQAGGDQTGGRRQSAAKNGTDTSIPSESEARKRSHASHRGMGEDDIVAKEAPEHAAPAQGERFADTVTLDRSREQWKNAAYEMGIQLDSYVRLWGIEGSSLSMNLRNVTRRRHDYRTFLRKFATQGEHLRINDDEFDYVYYCYGLDLYGNLPLIEPLEYAEERRIRDLVIAIDTSASTKDGLVRRFLEKTAAVLSNEDSFFSNMNVLIMQCDAAVTDVASIPSRRDFDEYLEQLEIKGLGGTDFRPVFSLVNDRIASGDLPHVAGLLYFTDGQGTFPQQTPSYPVAFVFADGEGASAIDVPSWAMKTALEDDLDAARQEAAISR